MQKKSFVKIGAIFLFLVAFSIILYWKFYYIRTPQYSLLKLKVAIEQHDTTSFEKYVDIDFFLNSLLDQFSGYIEDMQKNEDNESIVNELAKGLFSLLKPKIIDSLKRQIIRFIETGDFEKQTEKSEIQFVDLSKVYKRSTTNQLKYKGISYVKKEGKIAYVGLSFFDEEYSKSFDLCLKMRNKGNYWQVVEVTNLKNLLRQYNNWEEKKVQLLNKPIEEKLNRSLIVKKIRKGTYTDKWGFEKKVILKMSVKNLTKKKILKYKVKILCRDKKGNILKRVIIVDDDPISPKQVRRANWLIDVNMFDEKTMKLFKTPNEKLSFETKVIYIKFNDGQELQLHKKWENLFGSA